MTMRNRLALVLFALSTVPAFAAAEPKLAFSLQGSPSPQRMRLNLVIESGITRAVRVYAQPSGRLLGVYVNSEAAEPVETSEWFHRTFPADKRPERFPMASFAFAPGARVTVSSDNPEPTDQALSIHVFGLWPTPGARDGIEEREDVFKVHVSDVRNFGFRIVRTSGDTELCCGDPNYPDGSCKRDCTTCRDDIDLHCCSETDTTCGWCGRTKAQCSSNCPMC